MKTNIDGQTVTVSSKGQIVIPLKLREILGISEGDKLVLCNVDGKIQIETLSSVLKRRQKSFMSSAQEVWNSAGSNWPDEVDSVDLMREERR